MNAHVSSGTSRHRALSTLPGDSKGRNGGPSTPEDGLEDFYRMHKARQKVRGDFGSLQMGFFFLEKQYFIKNKKTFLWVQKIIRDGAVELLGWWGWSNCSFLSLHHSNSPSLFNGSPPGGGSGTPEPGGQAGQEEINACDGGHEQHAWAGGGVSTARRDNFPRRVLSSGGMEGGNSSKSTAHPNEMCGARGYAAKPLKKCPIPKNAKRLQKVQKCKRMQIACKFLLPRQFFLPEFGNFRALRQIFSLCK